MLRKGTRLTLILIRTDGGKELHAVPFPFEVYVVDEDFLPECVFLLEHNVPPFPLLQFVPRNSKKNKLRTPIGIYKLSKHFIL